MLRIVRLSDGVDVHGITCDEIWVAALNPADSGFYRIRLDSLGPPTPAVQ